MANNKSFPIHPWEKGEGDGGSKFPIVPTGEATLTVLGVRPTVFSTGKNGVIFELENPEGIPLRHQCFNDTDKNGKWNRFDLKNTLEAITGEKPEHGPAEIDPDQLIGRKLHARIIHEEVWSDKHQRSFPKAKIESFIMPEQVSPGQTEIDDLPESDPDTF